jgi:hypothetical protein
MDCNGVSNKTVIGDGGAAEEGCEDGFGGDGLGRGSVRYRGW